MNLKFTLKTFMAITLFIVATQAGAVLIASDLSTPGDQLITRDTATELEWLDLTETLDISHADINMGTGGFTTGLGFRFATATEVSTMLDNGGAFSAFGDICHEMSPDPEACFPVVDNLLDLFGCTQGCGGTQPLARGMIDNIGTVIFLGVDTVAMTGFASGDSGFGGSAMPTTGSFLVRPSRIPEPSIYLLFCVGLISFIATGLIRKRLSLAQESWA